MGSKSKAKNRGAPNWWTTLSRGRKIFVSIAGAVGALLIAVAAIGGFLLNARLWPFDAPNAVELAEMYDQTSPARKCAQTEGVASLTTMAVTDSRGASIATVELRNAPACKTAWLRVTSSIVPAIVEKRLIRPAAEGLPGAFVTTTDEASEGPEANISFSEQLYAPGCIRFAVVVRGIDGAVLGDLQSQIEC